MVTYVVFCTDAYTEGDLSCDEDEAEVDMDAVQVSVKVGHTQESQEGDEETQDSDTYTYIDSYGQGNHHFLHILHWEKYDKEIAPVTVVLKMTMVNTALSRREHNQETKSTTFKSLLAFQQHSFHMSPIPIYLHVYQPSVKGW